MLYFLFQIYLIILLYVCIANALRVVQIITFGTFGTFGLGGVQYYWLTFVLCLFFNGACAKRRFQAEISLEISGNLYVKSEILLEILNSFVYLEDFEISYAS